ncbi:DUF4292 domain-containing protein [Xanthocytophaga agilis]|uniref:DUF4292 domain-containing protein n=1 Tax=Xanthocytophaga agilis TaxID=3048010 RepID=A0AAE3UE28_9BACT|nr:DUF4292 domain-containing protein [Xanthocytophaga agilis]MDJ1502498.1 DUF4292 domain-containing protein [Xanthocytophaga agilis]
MYIYIRKIFPIVVCALMLVACGKRVKPVSSNTTSDSAGMHEDEDPRINVSEIEFQFFKAKAKINYADAVANQTATVDLRIKRDSLIWMSISKLGIEGARVLITRDSAYVIDRLNNSFEVYDFKGLGKRFNFNLSFDIIQAAIFGNLPIAKNRKEKLKVMKDKDYYLLRQKEDSVIVDNYVSIENFKLKKALFIEPATNNSLSLDYENFTLINDVLFPFNSNISLQYKSPQGIYNTVVSIQYTKADVADKELKFPFNPPANRRNGKK